MGTVAVGEGLLHMEVATSQVTSRRATNALDPMEDKIRSGGLDPETDAATSVEQQSRLTVIRGGGTHRMEQPSSSASLIISGEMGYHEG